jgi:serine/threonine-protein kinase
MSLAPGVRIGPYEILSRLGEGGMGEVWKARDTRLDRTVAIKRLKGEHGARFQLEARAIAALNHPHICQIYDVGPDYLVLEYIEGRPLAGPMSTELALPLAQQIASALESAHSRGILHRDLKPANVVITEAGAKLLDFGLAKLTTDADLDATRTTDGAVMGTPAYMSPEQARGKPVDARSDIFSFGAVLYEMVSGQRAFGGASFLETLHAVVEANPAALDSPLFGVIKRCLAKDASERFSSAVELRAALAGSQPTPRSDQRSIAVLPFANMSRDADDDYFSDGLAEEIINALVKVPGLKVIARTSAFAFKGQNTDIRRIAEILGVTNVLEGSVRRAGQRIRVTAQLIAAADGTHLWSERYDRQMDDLFAMQDDIAAAITSELKLKFAPDGRPRRQPNLHAYEAYLRYRQYQWAFTPESLRRSRECLEQAIALDPEFALPYAGLADHHGAYVWVGVPADECMPRARELARQALERDPNLTEAHAYLGFVAGMYEYDWKAGERHFRHAMASQQVHWHVRAWYSCFHLFPLGRLAEARQQAEQVVEDNPLSQICHWDLAIVLEGLGLESEAGAEWRRCVELDPDFWLGWVEFGLHHAASGRFVDARECAEKALAYSPSSPFVVGLLAGALAQTGEADRSRALLDALPGDSSEASIAHTFYHFVLGEIDSALEHAGKALEQRNFMLISNFLRPFERGLSKSPAWPAVLAKARLSPALS